MSGGHGDNGGGDPNTGILRQILVAIGDLGARIGDLTLRIDETNTRLETGFRDVNSRLDQTNARLDNLIDLSGTSWRDLERRVAALEARVPPRD